MMSDMDLVVLNGLMDHCFKGNGMMGNKSMEHSYGQNRENTLATEMVQKCREKELTNPFKEK